jgi:sec-independent protein translocase protein TatC
MVAPSKEEEAELESSKAPLLEHLVELRNRLIHSMIAFLLAFLLCFFFAKQIYAVLTQPLISQLGPNQTMIYTALYETFFTYVKVGMFGALCLAFPYMAYQLWMFIAPGLYRHERAAFVPFLVATPVMFMIGASFVYFIMLPFAIRFFLSFQTEQIQLQARVGEYLSFVMTLIFAFGFCFEMPVLLMLLGRVGIVTSAGLAKVRRYAIVAVFAVAAVVTPPDVFSQLSLAFPMVGLYEMSIWGVWLIERNRAKREAAEAAASRNIQTT